MDGGKVTKVKIIYEDNHLLVALKPSGILAQSDGSKTEDMLTLLKQYLKEKYQKPGNVYLGLVHRLDKPVSGLMVFARTSKAAARLSEQIRNHQFEKEYLAIVEGTVKETDTLEDYLEKKDFHGVISTKEKGKYASLTYHLLATKKNHSLVEIKLKTGRYHQIRVQFASRGWPLLGDEKYGKKGAFPIALQAHQLAFFHPITKEKMTFTNVVKNEGYWTEFTL